MNNEKLIRIQPCPFCGNEVKPIWVEPSTGHEYEYTGDKNTWLTYFRCHVCETDVQLRFHDRNYGSDISVRQIIQWNHRSE